MEFSESDVVESRDEDDGTFLDISVACQAAATGDTDTLVAAIKNDPSILETQDNSEGLTPLGHAVMAQQLECMKILVKIGANINAQDNFGRSLLSVVAYQGWYEGLMFLLRNGASQQTVDKAGRSPLHAATYDTNVRIIKALVQTLTIDDINLKDNEGMTALHWAAFHNRPEYVQLLLRKNANPMLLDIDGKTALHWAAQTGSLNCSRLLANCPKASDTMNLMDATGKTPVHFAAAAGHKAVINLMAKIPEVDLEAEDPDERTPLHWAAASGHVPTVAALLDHGVNACPLDMDGGSPLDYARQSGHKDCVQELEDRLGIHPIPEGRRATSSGNDRDKRSNLGLLSGLFKRKKKKKKKVIINEISSENLGTVRESSCCESSSRTGSGVTISDAYADDVNRPSSKHNKKSNNPSGHYVIPDRDAQQNSDSDPNLVKDFQISSESICKDFQRDAKASHTQKVVADVYTQKQLPPLLNKSSAHKSVNRDTSPGNKTNSQNVSSKDLEKMAEEWFKSKSPENMNRNFENRTIDGRLSPIGLAGKSASVGDICNGADNGGYKLLPSPPNTTQSNPERKIIGKAELAPLRLHRSKFNSVSSPVGMDIKVAALRLDTGGMNRPPTPPKEKSRSKPSSQLGSIAHDVERFRELTQPHGRSRKKDKETTNKKKTIAEKPHTPFKEIDFGEDLSQNKPRRISPVRDLSSSPNNLVEFHHERRALDKGLNSLLR